MNFLLESVSEAPSLRVLNPDGRQLLTPREEQVVALVAEVSAIATRLGNSTLASTPSRNYLFRIFDKLGISSRVELVLYAVHHQRSPPGAMACWHEPLNPA
jgi:DNA-binding NarL/FixJ family response regulator